jgi:hypothetical protein
VYDSPNAGIVLRPAEITPSAASRVSALVSAAPPPSPPSPVGSFTKLKYKEDGETKKLKNKQDYRLTEFRYGLLGRIGFGDFSIVGYYNLTPLFEEGNGLKENGQFKDFNTFTIGISLASF